MNRYARQQSFSDGLSIIRENTSFRASIQTLDTYLKSLREAPSWTIEQTLRAPAAESLVSHPSRSQPLCTAVLIALSDLFRQWGVVPQLVVGHSSGEIAAAYTAGRMTSYEAIAVAYYRGLVVSRSTFRLCARHIEIKDAILAACIEQPRRFHFTAVTESFVADGL